MALRRAFKISTIIIMILLGISALMFALNYLDIFPVTGMMQNVPVVGELAVKRDKTGGEKSTDELIKEAEAEVKKASLREIEQYKRDIERYKKKVSEIEQQVSVISKEKKLLETRNMSLQTKVDGLEALQKEQELAAKPDFPKLAQYYSGMKPAAAVKIMDNLTVEMNVGILQNLEGDQVAKILSAMDPKKAAVLVEQMNGQENSR